MNLEMISLMIKRGAARRRRGLVEGVEIMMRVRIASRTGLGSHPAAVFSFHASGHLLMDPGHECRMKIGKIRDHQLVPLFSSQSDNSRR